MAAAAGPSGVTGASALFRGPGAIVGGLCHGARHEHQFERADPPHRSAGLGGPLFDVRLAYRCRALLICLRTGAPAGAAVPPAPAAVRRDRPLHPAGGGDAVRRAGGLGAPADAPPAVAAAAAAAAAA